MFFSIVTPAYNAESTIKRAIRSVINQDLDATDYEYILSDDGSTDNTVKIVEEMIKDAPIPIRIIYNENDDPQGPGNARQRGIAAAQGDYIIFLDADDLLYEDILATAKNKIIEVNKEKNDDINYFIFEFDEWDLNSEKAVKEFVGDTVWVHGKIYRRQYLIDNAIEFKKDLFTHEDLYFNNTLTTNLISNGKQIYIDKIKLYKWILKQESITRRLYDGHIYIEEYLNEYLESCIRPQINLMKKTEYSEDNKEIINFSFKQCVMSLLHAFFYIQSFLYTQGLGKFKSENIQVYNTYLEEICKVYRVQKDVIVNAVYGDPKSYIRVKNNCLNGCMPFVEIHSFGNFISDFIPNFLRQLNSNNVTPFPENKEDEKNGIDN